MNLIEVLFVLLTLYAVLFTIYVVAIPIVAGIARQFTQKEVVKLTEVFPSIAVIVPAYNMENFVARSVGSLRACNYPEGRVEIFVVADHCTDDTAVRAIESGAFALVRGDGPRGKTYALAWAFEALKQRNTVADLYIIVDATARVDSAFLKALAERWMEGEEIVISRAVVDPENQQWFAQCLGLTLAHRNLQNRARETLGLSAFISGRGMAYRRDYVEKFGWTLALPNAKGLGAHPTEDWRHGVRIAEKGLRAAFAENALVFTPLRASISAATEQGIRWERGRILNSISHGSKLLAHGLRERSVLMLMAALDATQPPVAVLMGLCFLVGVLCTTDPSVHLGVILCWGPLVVISLYALVVLERGRREGIRPSAVLWAPVYIAWRCISFILALVSPNRSRPSGQNQASK